MESLPLTLLTHQKDHKPKQEIKVSYTIEDLILEVVCSLTKNEPSPRFISNGIHTKTRLEKLLGNGVESKLDASQDWS